MIMKPKLLTAAICIIALFSVDLTYGYHPILPYAYCNNNPVKFVDPDGQDYYQSSSGAVIWQDNNKYRLTINDEVYKNIGTSYSMQMADGRYANYYQDFLVSTSNVAIDAKQTIFNNQDVLNGLLSNDSPLTASSQQGLVTDLIHQAQSDFISHPVTQAAISGALFVMTGGIEGAVSLGNIAGKAIKTVQGGARLWPAASAGRTTINGLEYTAHALDRMQPVGTIMNGVSSFSRGVPPSVVENAITIKYGTKSAGNSAAEVVHIFENVKVVTNRQGSRVISVIKLGH